LRLAASAALVPAPLLRDSLIRASLFAAARGCGVLQDRSL
jgi:hypothetical protein